jgi:topoisomerase-4 subunit A
VKRFLADDTDKKTLFITEHEKSLLELVSTDHHTVIDISFAKPRGKDAKENEQMNLLDFISVKGMKALGNKLSYDKIKNVDRVSGEEAAEYLKISLEELEKDFYPEPIEEKKEEEEEITASDDNDEGEDEISEKFAEVKAETTEKGMKDLDEPTTITLEIERPAVEKPKVEEPAKSEKTKEESSKLKPDPKKTDKKDKPDAPSLFDEFL